MPDRPYTDDDLRAEAAYQHSTLTDDPDFLGVSERMQGSEIPGLMPPAEADGAEGPHWDQLLDEDQFDQAHREIHDLINDAADTSRWAIDLGADNLVPSTEHEITLNAGRPIARILFAFESEMPEEARTDLVEGIGDAINEAGVEREDETDEEPADSDSDIFDLISGIASKLRDATDGNEYHAVGLIYDLAKGRTTVTEARAELAELTFRHV
ncbi:hypothetical protein ACIRJS_32825 [Streptomyces sp. NPDC102340]|uniref:hypothetical protein n=1 Tax=unclassified Streptomyces TaxID=2593676 RepID=UPI00381D5EFB